MSFLNKFIKAENKQLEKNKKREMRVFISSTFEDMYMEREYLIKKVFPELRNLCRDRGVEFTEVDLRWGITSREAQEGKTLRICLEEIKRCHPFFIGILGERYGWVPGHSDAAKDNKLTEEFPFLNENLLKESSITEMEIIYGALQNRNMDKHAFFYFKHLNKSRIKDERLERLKEEILCSGYPVHENYETPEELGAWVKSDLEKVINRLYPVKNEASFLEAERRMHENFASSRYRGYIENTEYTKILDSFAEKGGVPLIVMGPSGSGKSALLANWSKSFKERNPGTFVISHYIGAYGPDSSNTAVLRRIMAEIKERYNLEDEVPASPAQIEADFLLWLNKVGRERLVLIIDAINQLEDNTESYEWLPVSFPKNVRLIISAAESKTLETMLKRSWSFMTMRPININERQSMIDSFLQGYSKKLNSEQRSLISCSDNCSNPLFLRTILEEIRVFGSYQGLDEKIKYYMASKDIKDLFARLLKRMEEDYGKQLISSVMKLIWCSRRGLSETELVEAGGFTRLELSRFLIAFDYNLMSRGGLLSFFHIYLRKAVEERYLRSYEDKISIHRIIASCFEKYPVSQRVTEELPWQYKMSGEHLKLKDFISNIPVFMILTDEKRSMELMGYWIWLKDRYDMAENYRRGLEYYSQIEKDAKELIRVMNELARFFQYMTKNYNEAEVLYEKCINMSRTEFGENSLHTARYINNLATLLQESKRDFHKAMLLYGESMNIREKLAPLSDDLADNLNNMAALLVEQGNFGPEVGTLYKRAISIYKEVHGEEHELIANAKRNMAIYYFMNKEYDTAEQLWYEALNMDEQLLGPHHVKVSGDLFCISRLLNEIRRDNLNAEKICRRALKIKEDAYGADHPDTISDRGLLADILFELGDYSSAESMHRRNLSIYKSWTEVTNYEEIELNSLAVTLWKEKKYDEAENAYKLALDIGKANSSETDVNRVITRQNLAVVLRDKGSLEDAEAILLDILEFWKKNRDNAYYAALCMYHLGILYYKKYEINKAEKMYFDALKLWESMKAMESSHYALCLYELSKLYRNKKDMKGSRRLLEKALEIHVKAKGINHPDSRIIRDALTTKEN